MSAETNASEKGRTYLYDSLRLHQMRTTTHSMRGLAVWRDLVHGLPEEFEIFEAAGAVRVHHEETASAAVEHAVAYGAPFPDVFLENDDADVAVGVLCSELEGEVCGTVARAVVHD